MKQEIFSPGERVPGTVYRVISLLDTGGMGAIYEVEDVSVEKRYVLKTLHFDLRDRVDLATRMAKEARVLARLTHPNIVEVVTAGITADARRLPYFVMERLRGCSLRQLIEERRGGLPAEASLRIAIDLLDALDYANEQGIVHRDVKPENVFLHKPRTGPMVVKLLDFGVMRIASDTGVQITGGRFIGTYRYAPPEQLVGDVATAQADLYSVGLVLYEMLAGRGPFDDVADDDTALVAAHLTRAPKTLIPWLSIPQPLDQLLQQALAKSPAQRPRDAFNFASQLRSILRQLRHDGTVATDETVEAIVVASQRRASQTAASPPGVGTREASVDLADPAPHAMRAPAVPVGTLRVPYTAFPVEARRVVTPPGASRVEAANALDATLLSTGPGQSLPLPSLPAPSAPPRRSPTSMAPYGVDAIARPPQPSTTRNALLLIFACVLAATMVVVATVHRQTAVPTTVGARPPPAPALSSEPTSMLAESTRSPVVLLLPRAPVPSSSAETASAPESPDAGASRPARARPLMTRHPDGRELLERP